MANVEFFKQQAKKFLKDYNSRILIEDNEFFEYEYYPKYFEDILFIVHAYGIKEDGSFTLMNAQHIVARLAGFSKWNELTKASEPLLEIGKLLLTYRESYELKQELSEFLKKPKRNKSKSQESQVLDIKFKISIVEDWAIYEKNNLQNVDDNTKLEVFKKVFLELDSANRIRVQKNTLDFSNNFVAQDMLMKIIKKKNLSPEKAILSSITTINCLKTLTTEWADMALSLWGHSHPDGKMEKLENPLIEVNLSENEIPLLETVMKKQTVSLEVAVQYFILFALASLGYHI